MGEKEKIEFLFNTIKNHFNKNITTISADDKLSNLGLDSLDIVEIQMFYEDEHGVEIKDPTKPLITVSDLIELIP